MVKNTRTTRRSLSFLKVKTQSWNALKDILKYIHELEWEKMYTNKSETDERIFLRWIKEDSGFIFGLVCTLRLSWIPKKSIIWDRGVSDIWLLDNEWVTETTHFLFSPSHNLLVLEYNHFGPRIWTFEWHLNERANTHESWTMNEVVFEPILNKETIEKLEDMGEIKLVSFTVPKTNLWTLAQNDSSLYEMLRNAFDFWDTWEVTITLKAEWRKRAPILEDVGLLKTELEKFDYEIGNTFTDLKVRAMSSSLRKIKTFDLLQDKIKDDVTVIKLGNSRDIDSDDMLEKMKNSFTQNKDELIELANWENV